MSTTSLFGLKTISESFREEYEHPPWAIVWVTFPQQHDVGVIVDASEGESDRYFDDDEAIDPNPRNWKGYVIAKIQLCSEQYKDVKKTFSGFYTQRHEEKVYKRLDTLIFEIHEALGSQAHLQLRIC